MKIAVNFSWSGALDSTAAIWNVSCTAGSALTSVSVRQLSASHVGRVSLSINMRSVHCYDVDWCSLLRRDGVLLWETVDRPPGFHFSVTASLQRCVVCELTSLRWETSESHRMNSSLGNSGSGWTVFQVPYSSVCRLLILWCITWMDWTCVQRKVFVVHFSHNTFKFKHLV